MIEFLNIAEINIHKKTVAAWLNNVLFEEGKTCGNIVYVFCDDDFLLQKNLEYLNHEELTDVISFDYSKKNIISGDILISIDRIKENSEIFNVEFLIELKRVMVHGLLHLLGYKDKTKTEKALMRKKEDYYLSKKQSLEL